MFNIKTKLDIRLASATNLHNVDLAKALISHTAQEAGALNTMHHLNALESKQDIGHLIWLAEHQGSYIGWASLEMLLSEEPDAVYLTASPLALYVDEEHRMEGIGSFIIEQAAKDAASLIKEKLAFQNFNSFKKTRSDGAEVSSIYLDIEASCRSEIEESLTRRFERSMSHQLEQAVTKLPYFIHSNLELDEAY